MSNTPSDVGSKRGIEENNNEESSQAQGRPPKRREYKRRSKAWTHFDVEFKNGVCHGICKYCKKAIPADPVKNGTTPLKLNTHVSKCDLNPQNKLGQSMLCMSEAESANGVVRESLNGWKFDAEAIRKSIANMIIIDELPFKHVDGKGFQNLMRTCCPAFKIPSRWTISRDCYQLYLDEKDRLKSFLKHNSGRICLTIDTWTSIQRINYMCLTAHYIDNDWQLNKKILNFCPISSRKGNEIGRAIEKCLFEWGIENVLTVTVDNASSNDLAVQYLKGKFHNWGKSVLGGKWTHVRCVAHIINLIVSDSMKYLGDSVESIRAAVKYIRQSPARLKMFKQCAELEKIESKKLCLDVASQWNSTYTMLDTAEKFERAFERFEEEDPFMMQELGCPPKRSDWEKARHFVKVLKVFYQVTLRVSGSKYVTSNNFFSDISNMYGTLKDLEGSENDELRAIARIMKEKYLKYWGRIEKLNMLIFVSSILDPRFKLEYLEFVLCEMYGDSIGMDFTKLARNAFVELFNEYKGPTVPAPALRTSRSSNSSIYFDSRMNESQSAHAGYSSLLTSYRYKEEFKKRKMELGRINAKSELDKYLNEECEDEDDKFDILLWWKANSLRFPILAKMARDVLAIPISTVASEAGGRVLDAFKSSLTPRIVQSLICAQDWLRNSTEEGSVEEDLEEIEAFESELLKAGCESTIIDL